MSTTHHQQLTQLDTQTSLFVTPKNPREPNFIKGITSRQEGNRSFRRRSRSKHHLGLSALVHSTYRAMCRAIASCNGCCDWSVPRLAAYVGVSERQLQRDVKVLVARGLIEKTMRRGKAYGNETNLWKRVKLGSTPPGDKLSTERQVLLNAGSTSAIAPVLPRAREGAPEFTPATGSPNEPPSPANQPAQAKIPARMPKKPRPGWNRRGQSVYRQPNPAQKAARRVMEALGVSPGLWGSRDAIVHALGRWMQQNPTRGLDEASEALLTCRREALRLWDTWPIENLQQPHGLMRFFGPEDIWQKPDLWLWDRKAAQLQQEVSFSEYVPDPEKEEEEARGIFRIRLSMSESWQKANPWNGKIYPDIVREIEEWKRQQESEKSKNAPSVTE